MPHYDTSLGGAPVSWPGLARIAEVAEAGGLDSLWVSDHLFLDWSKYGGPLDAQGALECWTTVAALGAITERVTIGTLTVCNDLRNPALLAKMAASVDVLTKGRLALGMGAGWYEPEYLAAGVRFDRPSVRIERLGEAVQIVTRLLDGEELTFEGRHYKMTNAISRPKPARGGLGRTAEQTRPPVFVGGKGDLLLETAARHADGWNFSWLGSMDVYADRVKAATAACEKVGRDPSSLRRSVGAYVLAGRDDRDVRRRADRLFELTAPGVLPPSTSGGEVSWEEFRRDRIVGSVGEVVDRLGRLQDLDVEEVIVTLGVLPFQLVDEEDVEPLAEVASALR